jgi:hypothetical protein
MAACASAKVAMAKTLKFHAVLVQYNRLLEQFSSQGLSRFPMTDLVLSVLLIET